MTIDKRDEIARALRAIAAVCDLAALRVTDPDEPAKTVDALNEGVRMIALSIGDIADELRGLR